MTMARPKARSLNAASATEPHPKRAASPATPLRQSKRNKSASTTPAAKQSSNKKPPVYREASTELSESAPDGELEDSGYEDQDESAVSSPSEPDATSDEYNSEEEAPRKRKTGRSKDKPSLAAAKSSTGKQLWKEGVSVDAAPGQEVFIKLPKARTAGATPYRDDVLHPNTMLFLSDLKRNNERAWLKVHDADYRQAQSDFNSFVECLTEKLIEKDDTIPELPAKDLVFRIYRDIRFSSDPTPYKTHFSAAWSRTGRKGNYAHYYLQVAPGSSLVGGGIWHPESQPLALLRDDVNLRSRRIKRVLVDPGIRRHFLGGIGDEEKKAVKAFIGSNSENALKTKPKVSGSGCYPVRMELSFIV